MKLTSEMVLYATAAGGQSEGSNLINNPDSPTDTPAVRDIARHRLVKTNPDIDAQMHVNETPQTDSAGLVGKKYLIQDHGPYGYGHFISEHDNSESATTAALARPGGKVVTNNVPRDTKMARKAATKKAATENPDVQ